MTNKNYTHIATVVDRSGSMHNIAEDMRGALDTFFEEQAKEPGLALVDYAQFDTTYELVYEDKHVSEAKAVLEPRGGTALNDAIGKTVANLGEKLRKKDESERPGKVIVVIVTDGGENSSREWTVDAVKKVVEEQTEKYNWDFIFLGANMDAVQTGAGYGIGAANSLTYDVANTGATMDSMSNFVTQTRSGKSAAFTAADRKAAVKK